MSQRNDLLTSARTYAVFTSWLETDSMPTPSQLTVAIRSAIRERGGSRGCLAEVAYAYGDHPHEAASRMRWAKTAVERGFPSLDRRHTYQSIAVVEGDNT